MLFRFIDQWRTMLGMGLGKPNMWDHARMVFCDIPVDAAKVRSWLPFPLRLARPARATLFIADYPKTTFGCVYREAAVLIHARLFGIFPVLHCPWMVVDCDQALIWGRELLGYPKKMAQIEFAEGPDGRFHGSVARRGFEVMRFEGAVGARDSQPGPGIGRMQVNIRSHISVFMPGHLLTVRPSETVHEANQMQLRVELKDSPYEPLGIAAGPAERATIRTCDIGGGLFPPPMRIWPVGPAFMTRLSHLLRTR
ncbi:acetoacetate decarboxylase family protein [Aquabacterium sp.]|uniref:acetoacetate decarboxylase family protein n=1 Tax=Aquabacterium sp. TaxID=1872578 RepID=UPI0035B3B522